MRAQAVLQLLVSQDQDQLQKVLDEKLVFDDTSSKASTYASGTYILAASATSIPVSFNGVTNASMVFISVTAEVGVQLGSNTAPVVPIRPFPAVPEGTTVLSTFQQFDQRGYMLLTGKITSLFLSNASTTTAVTATVFLLGEAA